MREIVIVREDESYGAMGYTKQEFYGEELVDIDESEDDR